MKKKDDLDFLFNKNESNAKDDKFDNLFKTNNEKDISNIDSELNKILGKDSGLNFDNNYYNNKYTKNLINNNNDDLYPQKFKSQKLRSNINNINGINLGEKPYEKSNLKPINRRGGGGLMAIGYEPNKNSIFNDMNFGGGFGLNKKNQDNNRFGFKKELNPIIMKEKKNDNIFGFNREDKLRYNNPNINFGTDKFSKFENNNILANKFNNEHNIFSRRKNNYHSSPNSLGWGVL